MIKRCKATGLLLSLQVKRKIDPDQEVIAKEKIGSMEGGIFLLI
jgi:hypothetical protein